jgi:hypothetical protein
MEKGKLKTNDGLVVSKSNHKSWSVYMNAE